MSKIQEIAGNLIKEYYKKRDRLIEDIFACFSCGGKPAVILEGKIESVPLFQDNPEFGRIIGNNVGLLCKKCYCSKFKHKPPKQTLRQKIVTWRKWRQWKAGVFT